MTTLPAEDKKARGTCWSLTINNPTEEDTQVQLPSGWRLEGQFERGEENGTLHLQGMLKTRQERWSAIKKVFPRAHILPAKNVAALKNYVHKEETRVGEFETRESKAISWFEYSNELGKRFDLNEYAEKVRQLAAKDVFDYEVYGNLRLKMIDAMVESDIESGRQYVEHIAVNPNFRQVWKRYGVAIARREQRSSDPPDQDDHEDRESVEIDRS